MSAAESALPVDNPYVGPRTFSRAQYRLFFGRDREARDLLARVVSERLLLFYAQSGAGKSSLINARLIPGLQGEGFAVLPIARVGGELPAGLDRVENVFLFNLMHSLDHREGDPKRLAGLSLTDFLASLTTEDGEHWEYSPEVAISAAGAPQRFVLIIDQFEEIIAAHPDRWDQREVFFRQLDLAMRNDPNLWVVMALREDFVAALDPYAHLMSDRLRARFYMERMGVEAALEAVREPAALGRRPFAPDVAEKLVNDLRQVRATATGEPILGQYVEPVQLQVVCRELWVRLDTSARPRAAGDSGQITFDDLQQAGDVNQALERFYEATLPAVLAQTGLSERALRNWVSTELITPAQTRGLVYRGTRDTAGLPHPGIDLFDAAFLVRPVLRGNDTWYELSHDRLVEPAQEANHRWQATYDNPLTETAREWQAAGNPASRLLEGRQLQEARAFAAAHPDDLTDDEMTFLAASESAYREARRRRALVVAGFVGIVMLALLAGWALLSRSRAQEQKQLADSRQLAAAATDNLAIDPELSTLLGIEALETMNTREAQQALHTAVQNLRLEHALVGHVGAVRDAAVSPDGKRVATAGADTSVRLWDAATGDALQTLSGHTDQVWGVAFSPDGSLVASASLDGTARVWDTKSGGEELRVSAPDGGLYDVTFSPDERLLATGGEDGIARVWDADTGALKITFGPASGSVWGVAFSPDGLSLGTATGMKNPGQAPGLAQVWDIASGEMLLTLEGHSDTVEAIAFSPDGTRLITGSWDETARVWNALTGELALTLAGHTNWVRGVAFSPDGKRLVTASWDRRAKIWDLASGSNLFTLAGHTGDLCGVVFTPDNSRIVTSSSDGTARAWNAGPTSELMTVIAHDGAQVEAVSFASDGATLATAGADGTARVWDSATGKMRFQISHFAPVNDVAYSSDSQTLATASDDRTARLWEASTGAPMEFSETV